MLYRLFEKMRDSLYIGNLANGNRADRRKAKRMAAKKAKA